MVKQFSGYRVKGCKEFTFIFGEISVKLKAAELQRTNCRVNFFHSSVPNSLTSVGCEFLDYFFLKSLLLPAL